MSASPLRLKKNEERRLRTGHLWVYSNEVDTTATPLNEFETGQPVIIEASNGKFIGHGYINPHSLICARITSREKKHPLSQSLISHRLKVALSLRERLFDTPHYRLFYGESDLLPGLVVDRFGDTLVVQINTAGMEAMKTEIIAALEKELSPKAILLRNDSKSRTQENLELYSETVLGDIPDTVPLIENGVHFEAPLLSGQKTGWFYDHRLNRARVQQYAPGARVLDLFSYIGGWGIQAAAAGASEVMCIDSSAKALDLVQHNAELNGVSDKVIAGEGDAFEALKSLRAEQERFDLIILDPPAFIKRKKDFKEGLQAYRRINEMAMQVLSRDGILVSASCSYHLTRENLKDELLKGSRHMDRHLQILEQGGQGGDHPVHPAIVETDYLKSIICRVLPSS